MRKTLFATSIATLKRPYFAMLMKYKFFKRNKLGIPYGVNIFENFYIIRRFYSSKWARAGLPQGKAPRRGKKRLPAGASPEGPPRRGQEIVLASPTIGHSFIIAAGGSHCFVPLYWEYVIVAGVCCCFVPLYWEYVIVAGGCCCFCLLYTSPSPRDGLLSRMPSSA